MMTNEIIPYLEMCAREGASLQRGMNYRLNHDHSVLLMSVRPNAPYADRVEDDGATLIYEGHDCPRSADMPDPKSVDQPQRTTTGTLTENGKFQQAAEAFKLGTHPPERVRVYEKLKPGIWSYNGLFELVDAWLENDGVRDVFKFKLLAIEDDGVLFGAAHFVPGPRRRVIPTAVKVEVWKRDHGQCVQCGAKDDLHFDHIVPFSKGGSSLTADNVQLLCARHNLEKSDNII
jgi:hypothetical protein